LQLRKMALFTLKDHANTLAPFQANETLVVLHNLGSVGAALHDHAQPWSRP
jgi:hypothetical protein